MRETNHLTILKRPSHAVALLTGILLTCLAVAGHRFLPERQLTIDSSREGANFFPVHMSNGAPAKFQWIDQANFHFACQFPDTPSYQGCGFAYMLSTTIASKGIDLSRFRTLNLAVRYTGKAQYLRVSIRNFDPRFSRIEDLNSPKFNFVNIPTKDLVHPIPISLSELAVGEWWTTAYDMPREYSRPDLSNATVFNVDLQGDLAGTQHDVQIDKIEFVGDWISAESWYLGILCAWMILATTYVMSQWLRMRHKHREQRNKIHVLESEKEEYRRLSTVDALTNVLNRHGIERFVETLEATRVPASVIVIDLDHFKRVNDLRGHYGGDRVLRTIGEILRAHIRNGDGLGRWGGEEFVLVCPGASLANAADLAEKLRHRIKETNFIPEDPLPITASFGVATSHAEQSFEDVFQQADQALYSAKSQGRDRVVAAGDEEMNKTTEAPKSAWASMSGRFRLRK